MAGSVKGAWLSRDVRESLFAQPMKTALTFTAVTIGMLALSMLLAILAGLEKRARAQVAEIGADVVMVTASSPPDALTIASLRRLRALLPDLAAGGIRAFTLPGVLPTGATLLAADHEVPFIRGWQLEEGRWLDPADSGASQAYAVLSRSLADRLRLHTGDSLALRDTVLVIAGIMRDAGPPVILVPTMIPAWWMSGPATGFTYDAVFIKDDRGDPAALAARIQRDFDPGVSLNITTPETLMASTRRMMQTVRLVYGSVAVLCLALGGATLSSLMMVAIQQRIGEIGLRMSIGASWRDIFMLFLCEGLITTFAAGVAGLIAGLGLLHVLGGMIELPVAITPRVIATPILASALLGAIFSWYPAHTAASMSPADALRND